MKFNKKLILPIILGIILLVSFYFLAIKPVFIGYAVYSQLNELNYSVEEYGVDLDELEDELLVSTTDLTSCKGYTGKLLEELEKYSDKYSECNSELSISNLKLSGSIDSNELTKQTLKEEIDELEEELDELRFRNSEIIKNSANNICCKVKVDNSNINYFLVENNRIICIEKGTNELSC